MAEWSSWERKTRLWRDRHINTGEKIKADQLITQRADQLCEEAGLLSKMKLPDKVKKLVKEVAYMIFLGYVFCNMLRLGLHLGSTSSILVPAPVRHIPCTLFSLAPAPFSGGISMHHSLYMSSTIDMLSSPLLTLPQLEFSS